MDKAGHQGRGLTRGSHGAGGGAGEDRLVGYGGCRGGRSFTGTATGSGSVGGGRRRRRGLSRGRTYVWGRRGLERGLRLSGQWWEVVRVEELGYWEHRRLSRRWGSRVTSGRGVRRRMERGIDGNRDRNLGDT